MNRLNFIKTTLLVLNTNLTINWQTNILDDTLELIEIAVFYHLIGFALKNFGYCNFYYLTLKINGKDLLLCLAHLHLPQIKKVLFFSFGRPHIRLNLA